MGGGGYDYYGGGMNDFYGMDYYGGYGNWGGYGGWGNFRYVSPIFFSETYVCKSVKHQNLSFFIAMFILIFE